MVATTSKKCLKTNTAAQRLTAVKKFKVQSSKFKACPPGLRAGFKVKGSSGSRLPIPCSRLPSTATPPRGSAAGLFPVSCFLFPVPGSRLPVPESRLPLLPFKMRDTSDLRERFHERKCFCKSATYVTCDPSKTDAGGSKHYQVPIKNSKKGSKRIKFRLAQFNILARQPLWR